ncbi:MAG TPA: hypothetical protein VGD68_16650 [Streptosporangiaceae bacterium]
MFAIIALVVVAIVALTLVHALFSPWLLLVALGIAAWIRFGSRRSRR